MSTVKSPGRRSTVSLPRGSGGGDVAVPEFRAVTPPQALFLFAAGVVLLTVTRLRLPRALAPIIFALSGASLFIYLGQYVARDVVVHFLHSPLLVVAVALTGGVGLWLAWVRGLSLAGGLLRRPLPVQADATI